MKQENRFCTCGNKLKLSKIDVEIAHRIDIDLVFVVIASLSVYSYCNICRRGFYHNIRLKKNKTIERNFDKQVRLHK